MTRRRRERGRWPSTAPVFRVTEGGYFADKGGIGIGVEIEPPARTATGVDLHSSPGYIGVILFSGLSPFNEKRHPRDGWGGAVLPHYQLRPLTPAAAEMLAIVKAGR